MENKNEWDVWFEEYDRPSVIYYNALGVIWFLIKMMSAVVAAWLFMVWWFTL